MLQLDGTGPLVPPALPLIHAGDWLTWAAHGYFTSRASQSPVGVARYSRGL